MKRINEYKRLFEVKGVIELAPLKKKYRLLVKEWHPDKFPDGGDKAVEAEEMSRRVIEGYHFLVSISPATKMANLEEFTATTTTEMIEDFQLVHFETLTIMEPASIKRLAEILDKTVGYVKSNAESI